MDEHVNRSPSAAALWRRALDCRRAALCERDPVLSTYFAEQAARLASFAAWVRLAELREARRKSR